MYSMSRQNGRIAYGVKHFVCDIDDDILSLPKDCEVGSTAFVIGTSSQYMLNNKKEWVQYQSNSGGGSCPDPGGDIIYDGGVI